MHYQLLALLHNQPTSSNAHSINTLTKAEWQELLASAKTHQVAALLYHRLRDQAMLDAAPDHIREALQNAYRQSAYTNIRLYRDLGIVLQAFRRAGIPAIVLKGAYLAKHVYADIALREMVDIDLLVQREDLQRAADVLKSLDYQPAEPFTVETDVAVDNHLPAFIKRGVAPIELHWQISKPRSAYTVPLDDFWQRAKTIALADVPALAFAPEDLLVHLCLHFAYRHLFAFGLRPVLDIDRTISHFAREFDWRLFQQTTESHGWTRGVYLALYLAQKLIGADVPEATLAALRPSDVDQGVLQLVEEQCFADKSLIHEVPQEITLLWGDPDLGSRSGHLLERLFPSPHYIAKQYHLQPGNLAVYPYYLVRLKDMFMPHMRALTTVLFNRNPQVSRFAKRQGALYHWLIRT